MDFARARCEVGVTVTQALAPLVPPPYPFTVSPLVLGEWQSIPPLAQRERSEPIFRLGEGRGDRTRTTGAAHLHSERPRTLTDEAPCARVVRREPGEAGPFRTVAGSGSTLADGGRCLRAKVFGMPRTVRRYARRYVTPVLPAWRKA